MSYVESVLQPDEQILELCHLHWITYVPAMLWALLAAIAIVMASGLDGNLATACLAAAAAAATLAAILAAAAWFDKWITELAVTDRRVIYKHGFIRRHTVEMNMNKIETVLVDQSLLGRMLDFGTVHVRGSGQSIEHLHSICSPLRVRSAIVAH